MQRRSMSTPPDKPRRQTPHADDSHAAVPARAAARQFIDSRSLLAGADCVAIRHGDELYCLRTTRQGKLLLTK